MNTRRPARPQPDPRQMSLLWDGTAAAPPPADVPRHDLPPRASAQPQPPQPQQPPRKMSESFRSDAPPAVHVPAPVPAPERMQPPAGVAFRHPHASREIRLGEVLIAYEFKRARRRSIGMVVGTDGLSVRAPRWSSVADVEAALREKTRWICTKLAEQRERSRRLEAARIDWRDGTALPFLGETVIVVLDTRVTGSQLQTAAEALPGVPRLTLHVGLHHTAEPEQIRDTVQAWLQRQARRVFIERCEHFAQRLGVQMTKLVLSSAQTRWGSASADGVIRLNWRLVHFGLPTIDYVVAHELAHLREMNHSPAFWDVVRSVIPDLDAARERLKHEILPDLGT